MIRRDFIRGAAIGGAALVTGGVMAFAAPPVQGADEAPWTPERAHAPFHGDQSWMLDSKEQRLIELGLGAIPSMGRVPWIKPEWSQHEIWSLEAKGERRPVLVWPKLPLVVAEPAPIGSRFDDVTLFEKMTAFGPLGPLKDGYIDLQDSGLYVPPRHLSGEMPHFTQFALLQRSKQRALQEGRLIAIPTSEGVCSHEGRSNYRSLLAMMEAWRRRGHIALAVAASLKTQRASKRMSVNGVCCQVLGEMPTARTWNE